MGVRFCRIVFGACSMNCKYDKELLETKQERENRIRNYCDLHKNMV